MHIIQIPDNILEEIPVAFGRSLHPGKSYICTNAFAGMLLGTQWRVMIDGEMWSLRSLLKATPYVETKFDPSRDWNCKRIWLMRGGGWGDLLMLTPLIKEIYNRWPLCQVHVACGSQYFSVFDPSVLQSRIPLPDQEYDALISFEDTVEGTPDGEKFHIAQLFANKLGIKLSDLTPTYSMHQTEKEWALSKFPRTKLPRIGLQYLASALYRSYPEIFMVLTELAKEAEVFMFGAPGQVQLNEPIPNVVNLMEMKLSFRESAAVLSTCDSCVSPDSAMVHLAGALGIPCLGLYGPFPAELRINKSTTALQGHAPCAPCFFHAERPDQFPAGMPCSEKGRCVALESIDPKEVVKQALTLARNNVSFMKDTL